MTLLFTSLIWHRLLISFISWLMFILLVFFTLNLSIHWISFKVSLNDLFYSDFQKCILMLWVSLWNVVDIIFSKEKLYITLSLGYFCYCCQILQVLYVFLLNSKNSEFPSNNWNTFILAFWTSEVLEFSSQKLQNQQFKM